jgi:hypothetical protein
VARDHFLFLFSKRPRWGFTVYGHLTLLLLVTLFILLFFNTIHSILAPVEPVPAKVLVVEGSVNDNVLEEAIRIFHQKGYQLLITTGTPLDYGSYLSEYKNTAQVTGHSLLRLGLDSANLVMLSSDAVMHDRTYNSAIRLKRYMAESHKDIRAINLISQGVHGARSRLLFRAALGDSIGVGIISVRSTYYTENNWWRSSKGFREVMNETFGYFYVLLFFRPYENELRKK